MTAQPHILLIANVFPPIRGGSASVYGALARNAGGQIMVLATTHNYADGLAVIGWREHDRRAPYRIDRIRLLRTVMVDTPQRGLGRLGFLASDVLLRMRVTAKLLHLLATSGIRRVCIGDLLSSGWLIRLLRWVPGIRITAYIHGEEITTSLENANLRSWLAANDAIVVVSRFTEKVVSDLLGDRAAGRIRLIENGVDNTRFTPGERSSDLVALYGLKGCFVFVSVCRLVEKKGIDNTIRAFAQVVETHPDSRYLVVGTGPDAERLKAIARQEGVADRVIFAGQVAEDELVEHYRLGHVFVMPNRRMPDGDTEGFGLVFLEANGCGLPVVAGCDGGSTDAVRDGDNGLVVNGHSVPAIVGAMRRLRDDPGLYGTIRQNGLRAARNAGWPEKTRAFLEVCDPLNAAGAVPAE